MTRQDATEKFETKALHVQLESRGRTVMDRAMSRRVLPFLTLLCTSSAALATDYELSGTAVLDPNAIATNRIDPNGNVGSFHSHHAVTTRPGDDLSR